MERMRIWLDGRDVRAGELLRAVDGDGAAIAGARLRPIRQAEDPLRTAGPTSLGGANEGHAYPVLTDELGPGLHTFAVQITDARTGEADGSGTPVSVYLNTAPRGVAGVAAVPALVGGRLRFTYGRVTG